MIVIIGFIVAMGGGWSACTKEIIAAEEVSDPSIATPIRDTSQLRLHKYGKSLVFYAEVDKAGDYFRRMFIDSVSANIVLKTGEIPEGAILFLETWFGENQSTVYIRQKVNEVWQSHSFAPTSPDYKVTPVSSCNSCHSTAAATDAAFTKPLLIKALQRNAVQKIVCNQPSFTPCDLSVYRGN